LEASLGADLGARGIGVDSVDYGPHLTFSEHTILLPGGSPLMGLPPAVRLRAAQATLQG